MNQESGTPTPQKTLSFGKAIGMLLGFSLLGLIYVFILPVAEVAIVAGLNLTCPGFICTPLRSGISALPGNAGSWLAIAFVFLFVASVVWRSPTNPALRFLSKTHRYTSLLAIGVFGTEGFAWPVPYLLAVILAGSQTNHTERILRNSLEPFVLTWLVVGMAVAMYELVVWLQRRKNKNQVS